MPLPHDQNTAWIFCDGASSGNPGPGGWGALVIWNIEIEELGGYSPSTTNNRMEMLGVIEALERLQWQAKKLGRAPETIEIFTDSTYVIRGITGWIFGWKKRGWKNAEGGDVLNQDLWEILDRVVRKSGGSKVIHWNYVRGHQGTPGNERVDEIAVAFSKNRNPSLYRGPLHGISYDIEQLPSDFELPEMKPKKEPAPKAHSYLSLVNGVARRHSSWKECEAAVKGVSGAKFKKAMSPEEEQTILNAWGVRPEKLLV